MKTTTRTFTVTHFSLIGFDGQSDLWKNWDNFPFLLMFRCPISNSHYPDRFEGSLWHVSLDRYHFGGIRKPEIKVTGTLKLGEVIHIKYGKVEYEGSVNCGWDQSVLAFSILGIKGSKLSEWALTNSVKLYTNILTTKSFLKDRELKVFKIDKREHPSSRTYL